MAYGFVQQDPLKAFVVGYVVENDAYLPIAVVKESSYFPNPPIFPPPLF